MALTALGLCARALIRIGATPVTSFDDGSAEAEVAEALYAPARDALLGAHPWSFATAQARLPRLDTVPVADFTYAYALPSGFLRALSVGWEGRGRGLDYRIVGQELQADAGAVVLTYVFRPEESAYPAFFDQALIARLAAEFCVPLTESTSRWEALLKLAETEFRRARQIDALQDSQPRFEGYALIEARS